MKGYLRRGWLVIVTALLLLSPLGAGVRAQEGGTAASEPQALTTADGLIVRFDAERLEASGLQGPQAAAELAAGLSAAAGVDLAFEREMSGGAFVYSFAAALSAEDADAAAARLAQSPGVTAVEPDFRAYIALTPNDTRYGEMWPLWAATPTSYGVDAEAAWDLTTGDPNLVVAVLDTGILPNHPDLVGRLVGGYDFITSPFTANDGNGRDPDPSDPGDWVTSNDVATHPDVCGSTRSSSWHGSHVAGTIGASSDNGIGVAGINWQSKIMPVRVLGKCGGTFSDIIDAIRWTAGVPVAGVPNNPNPARVLNLSLGGYTNRACSSEMQAAINDAVARGAVLVVAAGNSALNTSGSTPANCANVITVGATEMAGHAAYYSNYGSMIEINAPGGDSSRWYPGKPENEILSTVSSSLTSPAAGSHIYDYMQGTSMASPHVAGIVSLMLSVNPGLNTNSLVSILQQTATPFNPASYCSGSTICGTGAIAHAGRAVRAASDMNVTPNNQAPAFVGMPNAPRQMTVNTSAEGDINQVVVRIGGTTASVVSRLVQSGRFIIVVQPPVKPSKGFYSLSITYGGGRVVTFDKAVYYGHTVNLPSVQR